MRLVPALLAVATLAACTVQVTIPEQSCWFTDTGWVTAKTGERAGELEVTDDMPSLQVELDVASEQGSASWSLIDPDGVVRWRCRTEVAQHLQQTCTVAATPGTWKVRREWTGFTGEQHFAVTGASPQQLGIVIETSVEPSGRTSGR
jgi:hypothetical protein